MSIETDTMDTLNELAISAKDFCLLNGLVMFDKLNSENESNMIKSFRVVHSPVTLLPSIYPQNEFDYATNIQNCFNELIYSISNDYEFLKKSYKKYKLLFT